MEPSNNMQIHRCRFIDWTPSAIHVMASNVQGLLAVGRENGQIEIWQNMALSPAGLPGWKGLSSIASTKDVSWTSLVWLTEKRLVGSTRNGALIEMNVETGNVMTPHDAYGGAIWSMAQDATAQVLYLGCEDGKIRVYSYANDSLVYERRFVGSATRVVSLAYHPTRHVLFSGHADGIIMKWDVISGRSLSRMTLENYRKEKTIVWCVVVLEDMTVLSGDSLGHIQVWDGETCTLLQTFSQLTSDVLTLTKNANENVIFASGIDSQVISLRLIKEGEWAYAYSHRSHTHDVRALVMVPDSNGAQILLSGGMDTQLVAYTPEEFATTRPRRFTPFPAQRMMQCAPHRRLLMLQKQETLDFYSIPEVATNVESHESLVLQMNLAGGWNIQEASLSPNGKFVAISTHAETKLFALLDNGKHGLAPKRIVMEPLPAAAALVFTPHSDRLVLSTRDGQLHVFSMETERIEKSITRLSDSNLPATTLAISPNAEWLVSADRDDRLVVISMSSFSVEGELPRPDTAFMSMGFSGTSTTLYVSTFGSRLLEYSMAEKTLLESCYRKNKGIQKFVHSSRIKSILPHPIDTTSIVLHSQNAFMRLIPHEGDDLLENVRPTKKAKKETILPKEEVVRSADGKIIDDFKPIVFMDFLNPKEMVIVEMPWLKILAKLPDALHRQPYGK